MSNLVKYQPGQIGIKEFEPILAVLPESQYLEVESIVRDLVQQNNQGSLEQLLRLAESEGWCELRVEVSGNINSGNTYNCTVINNYHYNETKQVLPQESKPLLTGWNPPPIEFDQQKIGVALMASALLLLALHLNIQEEVGQQVNQQMRQPVYVYPGTPNQP